MIPSLPRPVGLAGPILLGTILILGLVPDPVIARPQDGADELPEGTVILTVTSGIRPVRTVLTFRPGGRASLVEERTDRPDRSEASMELAPEAAAAVADRVGALSSLEPGTHRWEANGGTAVADGSTFRLRVLREEEEDLLLAWESGAELPQAVARLHALLAEHHRTLARRLD